VQTDPDVVFFRSDHTRLSAEQNSLMQELAQVCAFKATSDLAHWLSLAEKTALRNFLTQEPKISRSNRTCFDVDGHSVDFGPAMDLPAPPRGAQALLGRLTGWLGSQPIVLKILDRMGKQALEKLKEDLH
jgi:hypothetical protein